MDLNELRSHLNKKQKKRLRRNIIVIIILFLFIMFHRCQSNEEFEEIRKLPLKSLYRKSSSPQVNRGHLDQHDDEKGHWLRTFYIKLEQQQEDLTRCFIQSEINELQLSINQYGPEIYQGNRLKNREMTCLRRVLSSISLEPPPEVLLGKVLALKVE